MNVNDKYSCWTVVDHPVGAKVKCRCDCGVVKMVRTYDLTHGRSVMCRHCSAELRNAGHGHAQKGQISPEYVSYQHMLERCLNTNSKDYPNYGGRGIKVCQAWQDSYEAFYLCMGPKPNPDYTIDRINHNGNYEPGNCRWANATTQARNRRNSIMIELDGETKNLSEWIVLLNKQDDAEAIYKKIQRGADPKEALLAVIKKRAK